MDSEAMLFVMECIAELFSCYIVRKPHERSGAAAWANVCFLFCFDSASITFVPAGSSKHIFRAKLDWLFPKKEVVTYNKNHIITIDGKDILNVPAAKAFKGDPSLYNPEDLFLSSVVSCHMMSYLYVCKQNGIEVLSYTDNAEATLEVMPDGSGRFLENRLNPKVCISNNEKMDEARGLHQKAN